MSEIPTPEEIQRVHAWECASNGHQPQFEYELGSREPVFVFCFHCGDSWDVMGQT